MSAPAQTDRELYPPTDCAYCEKPTGDLMCEGCVTALPTAADEARKLLERFKYTAPGLTNAELALLERFVTELEGP